MLEISIPPTKHSVPIPTNLKRQQDDSTTLYKKGQHVPEINPAKPGVGNR